MRLSDDRGMATVEILMLTVLAVLLISGLIELLAVYRARDVVKTVSKDSARLVAAESADAEEGKARALQLIESGLGSLAENTDVQIRLGTDVVTVLVSTRVRGPLPIPISIQSETSRIRERFRPAGAPQ
jgi:Flp pilus assembly protein TadG